MATYQYHCPGCGLFDVVRPIGQAGSQEPCRACAGPSRRVFTAPMLARTPLALARALGAQEASAHQPQVVRAVPAAQRRAGQPSDPRHALLPKP